MPAGNVEHISLSESAKDYGILSDRSFAVTHLTVLVITPFQQSTNTSQGHAMILPTLDLFDAYMLFAIRCLDYCWSVP